MTYLSVNNKLCEKLVSSIPVISDDNLRVTPIVHAGFNVSSWESNNLNFTL